MRLIVVDDDRLVVDSLKIILGAQPQIEVVGTGANGNDAPAAAHGHVACDQAGDRLVSNIGPVRPGIDGASVHHERLRNVDPALRARRRQGPGTAKRQVAPHLHAAQRDVRIGRM